MVVLDKIMQDSSSRKCFECQGYGHFASNCPNQRVNKLVGKNEDECYINNDQTEDEDVTCVEQGMLIVCMNLNI